MNQIVKNEYKKLLLALETELDHRGYNLIKPIEILPSHGAVFAVPDIAAKLRSQILIFDIQPHIKSTTFDIERRWNCLQNLARDNGYLLIIVVSAWHRSSTERILGEMKMAGNTGIWCF